MSSVPEAAPLAQPVSAVLPNAVPPIKQKSSLGWSFLQSVSYAGRAIWNTGRIIWNLRLGKIEALRREVTLPEGGYAGYKWLDTVFGRFLIVTDPQLMRRVLHEEKNGEGKDAVFLGNGGSAAVRAVIGSHNIFTTTDPKEHTQLRAYVKDHHLSIQSAKGYLPWFEEVMHEFLMEIFEDKDRSEIYLKVIAPYYATKAMLKIILGDQPDVERLIEAVNGLEERIHQHILRTPRVPLILDWTTKSHIRVLDEAIDHIKGNLSTSSGMIADMIKGGSFNEAQIREMAMMLLFVARGNSSSAFATLLYALADNPELQQELYAEIAQWGPITYEKLNQSPRLTAFINAELSRHPPVWILARESGKSYALEGVQETVSKGTQIIMVPLFNGNESNALTFGTGNSPNHCVGQYVAMPMLRTFLACLIKETTMSVGDRADWDGGVFLTFKGQPTVVLRSRTARLPQANPDSGILKRIVQVFATTPNPTDQFQRLLENFERLKHQIVNTVGYVRHGSLKSLGFQIALGETPNTYKRFTSIETPFGPLLVLSQPNDAVKVLQHLRNSDDIGISPFFNDDATKTLRRVLGESAILTTPHRDEHDGERKWAMRNHFGVSALQSSLPHFVRSSASFADRLLSESKLNGEANATHFVRELTTEAIVNFVMGTDEHFKPLGKAAQMLEMVINRILLRHPRVPLKVNPYYASSSHAIREGIEFIQQHLDTTDSLIADMIKAKNEDDKPLFTSEQIFDMAKMALFVGLGTTTTAILFALNSLAEHPEWQERIDAECQRYLKGGVTSETIDQMFDLQNFIKEVLRLYPPVWIQGRKLAVPMIVEGYGNVPKGTTLLIPNYYSQRDASRWQNPEAFNPDRFRDHEAPVFYPFSIGPNSCLGRYLAEKLIKTVLISVVQRSRISLVDTSHQELFGGVVLKFSKDLMLRLNPNNLLDRVI